MEENKLSDLICFIFAFFNIYSLEIFLRWKCINKRGEEIIFSASDCIFKSFRGFRLLIDDYKKSLGGDTAVGSDTPTAPLFEEARTRQRQLTGNLLGFTGGGIRYIN